VIKYKVKNILKNNNIKIYSDCYNKIIIYKVNGNYKEHIKKLYGKGRKAVRKVWGLGEKLCRNDFRRRWILFRCLVQSAVLQSVIAYGVEIWGWKEKEKLEKIMMDYVRWLFGSLRILYT